MHQAGRTEPRISGEVAMLDLDDATEWQFMAEVAIREQINEETILEAVNAYLQEICNEQV